MKYEFSFYKKEDYNDLLRMALASYKWCNPIAGLSRIEFEMGLHPAFTGNRNSWEATVGMYRLDGNVVASIWSEGAYDGDVFFLFDNQEREKDIELLECMVNFAKKYASGLKEDGRTRIVSLFIQDWQKTLLDYAMKHGFSKGEYEEEIYILPFKEKMEVKLPEGYSIVSGKDIPDIYLSNVHRLSFNYGKKSNLYATEHGLEAFHEVRCQRYCKEYLTLCILDKEKQPVGMTIIWYDPVMSYCEMEPLAVVWWERRKGLATALIHEACNRIKEKYPQCKGITGGSQDFYKKMGFKKEESCFEYVWNAEIWSSWDSESLKHNYEKEYLY